MDYIQFIGLLGLLLVILSFQQKERGRILTLLYLAQILFTVHFSLLGAWTGAVMNGISAVRTFLFSQKDKFKFIDNPLLLYFFTVIAWIAGIMVWKNIYGILPIIAMTFDNYAVWHKKASKIRLFMIIPRPFWFIYNLNAGSIAGILSELFVFLSVAVCIIRYDLRKRNSK